ncbi:hypothetical protein MNB_SM-4-1468 [hydrothermal vent metagenome]|uniref:Uncharacterized protein n=1 Tax=hydrothermal vent metagenome TaxID=652676 RepID=A0A1W1B947_9ZZZZ
MTWSESVDQALCFGSHKKHSIHWVISALQEKTKLKRLGELITSSELGTNKFKDSKHKKKTTK